MLSFTCQRKHVIFLDDWYVTEILFVIVHTYKILLFSFQYNAHRLYHYQGEK